jgi:cell division protease FtsH
MRRFGKRTWAMARRHRALTLGLAAASFVIVGVISLAAITGAFNAPTPVAGAYTFTADWTLLDLQRHVDAGEVATIALVTAPAGVPVVGSGAASGTVAEILAARTTSGQWVRVTLAVSPGDALVALRSLGYGRLIAADSVAQIPASNGVSGSGSQSSDLLGGLTQIGMLVIVLVVAIVLVRRTGANSATGTGNYQVVLPSDPHGLDGDTGSVARPVRFADVAGCDEAKLELTEVVEFLRSPERFLALGASIPRGLLLYGPPGTGKTMLARAAATEAGVAFVSMSGSGFVEMYVGVGAKRVRNLFAVARKFGKAIIFVDEIDALAKTRGGNNPNDEREQALNQLLAEMDGFSTSDSIVVIAATNRLDTLDHAVLRPGRFTRKVNVPLPDIDGRRAILDIHAIGKPLHEAVDMQALARRTAGMSGAQLADLLNEAAIYAARRSHDKITPGDIHDGWLKSILGTSRKRSMDERERSIIAAHEAGHAVCGRLFADRRRVEEISLFAHGDALGVTVSSSEDDYLPSESDLRSRLVALMGGRAAEAILFEDVTGGASNDLEKATEIATNMVTKWGMGHDPDSATLGTSGRGTLSLRVVDDDTTVSVGLRAAMDRTINAILDQAYAQARESLLAEMKRLTRVAAYLYEHERIDGAQFEALFEGSLAPSTDVETQWRSAKSKPRSWDEIHDLIAMSVGIVDAAAPASAAQPLPARVGRPSSHRTRSHRTRSLRRLPSTVRLLLSNWWQHGLAGR